MFSLLRAFQFYLFIIHIENPTRCHSVSKFYFIFIWSSTCFGRHTAYHEEPKTALATPGFACVKSCWTCSCCPKHVELQCCWSWSGRPDHDQQHCHRHTPTVKPEAATAFVELLMMSVTTPETCWAVHKRQVITWEIVASSWLIYLNGSLIDFLEVTGSTLWPPSLSGWRCEVSASLMPSSPCRQYWRLARCCTWFLFSFL